MPATASRRAATLLLAVMGVLALVGLSGLKFERQSLGYVGVVRNGGPLDNRLIRQVMLPGQGVTFTGLFSQAPHEYPSVRALRAYTITADPRRGNRPGVDVVSVPTRDGLLVGIEGTIYLRFVGEADLDVLRRFDASVGTRRFPLPTGPPLYPWQGADGFAAMLDAVFRPILENNLRREIGSFDCAQLIASCALVRHGEKAGPEGTGVAIRSIEDSINQSLATELQATLGQPFFRDLRFRLVHVTLPREVQTAIDTTQSEYAKVNEARARYSQARWQARRTRVLGRSYRRSPALATIDAVRAAPAGSTVIVNTGSGSSKSPSIALGGN